MNSEELEIALHKALGGDAPDSVHEQAAGVFENVTGQTRRPGAASAGRAFMHSGTWSWLKPLGALAGIVAAVLVAAVLLPSARAAIDFVGIFATQDSTRFFLVDRSTGETSGWITINDSFEGFTLVRLDGESDTLVLKKDTQEIRLSLQDAPASIERMEVRGTVELGYAGAVQVERATLLLDRENVFPLPDGVVVRITPRRRDDGNLSYSAVYERRASDGTAEVLSAPTMIVLPGTPFSVRVRSREDPGLNLGFSFSPTKD